MSRSLPPLGWFRAFECAAQRLSFTAAANELGMTQSAVSQQIRSLESRLGTHLFLRKHRGLALTDEGRKLLPEVSRAINAIQVATAPFELQNTPDILTVATSVSVAQWYLAPAMQSFATRHPNINIRLLTAVWPDELTDSTDVQIRFGSSKEAENDYQPLGKNELVLVASPDLLGSDRAVQLNDKQLQSFALIQSVGTLDSWQERGEEFGFKQNHHVSLTVDTHGLAVDLAVSGSGIALTSELIAKPALERGLLVQINPGTVKAHDGYFIAITSQRHLATAQTFVDWLQQIV